MDLPGTREPLFYWRLVQRPPSAKTTSPVPSTVPALANPLTVSRLPFGSGADYSTFSVTFGRPLTSSNDETFARSEPSTCKKIAAPPRERENFFERRRHLGGTRLCPPD